MKEIIIEYESYLQEQKLSENTLNSYLGDLDAFLIYLKDNKVKNVLTIKRMTAEAYIEHMKDSGKANSTISRTIASLRKFLYTFDFLQLINDITRCGFFARYPF